MKPSSRVSGNIASIELDYAIIHHILAQVIIIVIDQSFE